MERQGGKEAKWANEANVNDEAVWSILNYMLLGVLEDQPFYEFLMFTKDDL